MWFGSVWGGVGLGFELDEIGLWHGKSMAFGHWLVWYGLVGLARFPLLSYSG